MACYTDAFGRRLKKSTKTKIRDEALKIALQLERSARLAARGELTEIRARELLAELVESVSDSQETIRAMSARQFLEKWLEEKRGTLAPGSLHSYEAGIGGFIEFLGPRADLALGAVVTEHLQAFINSIRRRGLSAKSCEIYGKVLRGAFKAARIRQLIRFNPAEGMTLPAGNPAERKPFTPAELQLLATTARKTSVDWLTVVLVGIYTGQRLRDCANARWSDVNLVENTITLAVAKKHGKKHTMPLHQALRKHLEAIAGDVAETYLAPSLANKNSGGTTGLSKQFHAIMKSAGVEAGTAEHDGKRHISSRSFHSLRHTFTSSLANSEITPELRQKLVGHENADVHKGYTHHEIMTLSKALSVLPEIN